MVFHHLNKRRAAVGLELASPLPGTALGLMWLLLAPS